MKERTKGKEGQKKEKKKKKKKVPDEVRQKIDKKK